MKMPPFDSMIIKKRLLDLVYYYVFCNGKLKKILRSPHVEYENSNHFLFVLLVPLSVYKNKQHCYSSVLALGPLPHLNKPNEVPK